MTAYPPNIEEISRYLSTQYPNNKPANQLNCKKGDKNKGNDPKSKCKDSNTSDAAGVNVGATTKLNIHTHTHTHTHTHKESVPPELLSKVPNVSQLCDTALNCQLDLSDKSKD